MKTVTLKFPSSWASAIINTDYSSLNADERKALNTSLALNGVSFAACIDDQSAGFCRTHDAFKDYPYAADCTNFTFRKD